jgi:hypothetical protein
MMELDILEYLHDNKLPIDVSPLCAPLSSFFR